MREREEVRKRESDKECVERKRGKRLLWAAGGGRLDLPVWKATSSNEAVW